MWGSSRKRGTSIDIQTLVGPGTRVRGDIDFVGGCHVDGEIVGNVRASGTASATLSISEAGRVEGSVSAPFVVLNGTVEGDVKALERVELGATAKVVGNVHYRLIEMAIGAEINGSLVHEGDPPASAEGGGQALASPAINSARQGSRSDEAASPAASGQSRGDRTVA